MGTYIDKNQRNYKEVVIPKPIIELLTQASQISYKSLDGLGNPQIDITTATVFNNVNPIAVGFDSSNTEFLNYNPKIFLFQQCHTKKSKTSALYARKALKKFVHHPHLEGMLGQRQFGNFTGGDIYNGSGGIIPATNEFGEKTFQTEWPLSFDNTNRDRFQQMTIVSISPKQHYYNPLTRDQGNDIFPISLENWNGAADAGWFGNTDKLLQRYNGKVKFIGSQKKLIFKFAIVCQNPLALEKPIIGPFSDELIIRPCLGWFYNGSLLPADPYYKGRYFYKWNFSINK